MRVNQPGNSSTPNVQSGELSGAKQSKQGAATSGAKRAEGAPAREVGEGRGSNPEISARGKELAHAKSIANAAPDTRADRIAELKQRIADGGYKVNAEAVADRMVDEHLPTPGLRAGKG